MPVAQGSLEEAVDLPSVVKKTVDLIASLTIDIPKIVVVPKGNVTARYLDFDLDTTRLPGYTAIAKDIIIQHLTDAERYHLVSEDQPLRVQRLEDIVVFELIRFDEMPYDETADLLYKLSGQAITHLRSYLQDPKDVENVLQHHRKAIADFIHAQMEDHFEESEAEYDIKVNPGFITIQPQLVGVNRND